MYTVGDYVKFVTDINHNYDWSAIIIAKINGLHNQAIYELELIERVSDGKLAYGAKTFAPLEGMELIVDEKEIDRLNKLMVFK